jgi:hypothetical protein
LSAENTEKEIGFPQAGIERLTRRYLEEKGVQVGVLEKFFLVQHGHYVVFRGVGAGEKKLSPFPDIRS